MILKQVVAELDLEVKAAPDKLDKEVTGGYVSDLLSDVIANSEKGNIWVTLQIHQNIVAVAVLRELAGIIIINGRQPDEDTIKRAEQEGIPIVVSQLPAFEVVGKLFQLGITGKKVRKE